MVLSLPYARIHQEPSPRGDDGVALAMKSVVVADEVAEFARAEPRGTRDAAAVQGTHEVDGRGIGFRRLEDAMRPDVKAGMVQNLQPLGFIAPTNRAFAREVAEFAETRVARDA